MNLDQRLRALAGEASFSPDGALDLEAGGFALTDIARALIPLVESDEEDLWWWGLFDFECLVADRRGLEAARALVSAVRPGSEGAFVLAYARRKVFGAVDTTVDYAALVQLAEGLGTTLDSGHVVGVMLQRQPLVKVLRDPDIPPRVLWAELHPCRQLADVFDELLAACRPAELADLLERFFDAAAAESRDELGALRTIGRTWRALGRTTWTFADLLESYAPAVTSVDRARLLRELDMSASLWILRRTDEGEALATVALEASNAGYTDAEVLHGFRENALGADRSLQLLAGVGWDVVRLVRSQLAEGISAAEVREHLRALGAPAERVGAALSLDLDAQVLCLVLGEAEVAVLIPAERR